MSTSAGSTCCGVIGSLFEYDTPRIVHIKNKKVGFLFRSLQLIVIAYIAGFVIAWKKGYQATDIVESSTTSKLKGIASTNYTALNISGPGNITYRIWDVADYVIPPQENDAFFVMTNAMLTVGQTQGKCPEDPDVPHAVCKTDSDCTQGEAIPNGNGIMTGLCIPMNESVKTCEIYAWCPVEIDTPPVKGLPLLNGTEDFTVLIKNNIVFNKFNTQRRNILGSHTPSYLQSCRFNISDPDDKYCPVFRIGDLVALAGVKNFAEIAVLGGVIAFHINWDCNLDQNQNNCLPQYSFQRLDLKDAKIAKGTNFRFANFYYVNEVQHRDLIKAYGILFLVKVTGQAGKFSPIPLFLNIGSGIGLLAVATLVCDFVLCYLLKNRKFYFFKKYFFVNDIQQVDAADHVADDAPLLTDGADIDNASQRSH